MNTDDTEFFPVDETMRRQFEAAWAAGAPQPIEDFLPDRQHPTFLTTLEELIHVELEFSWKAWAGRPENDSTLALGQVRERPAQLESFLKRFDQLREQDILLRLLEQEFLVRSQNGDTAAPVEYHNRFPELAQKNKEFNRLLERLYRETARKKELRTGSLQPKHGDFPRQFGNYELLEPLGQGGMGIVFRARQQKVDRLVALKVIRSDQLPLATEESRRSMVDRFRQEAQAAARLDHENIVTVYEVGEVEEQHFFSMQYIQGQSLAELLGGRPLDNRRAAAYLEPVARAVHEAHTSGILHRDLKPHNVLIESKTDRPLVADFGLAKLAEGNDELTRAGEAVGTPSYMSPEQAQDASQVTALTDVYALGATLYAALTGRPPFQAASSIETLRQVIDEDPVPPSRLNRAIGRDLDTICMKCLDKSPERRYPSSQHLAEDLGRYLRYEPIRARPVGRINRSFRWCRRNPLTALLSGLALTFLFLTLTSSFIGYVQTRSALRQAHDNLSEAHQAVEDFFSLVSESDLLNQQGLQPLRKELLQRARSYYERFISQRREDPTTRDELALTHFRIGRITDLIGSHQESLTEYQQAHDIQQQLLEHKPGDAHRMEALANTLNAMGVASVRQGQSLAAQQHLNEARRLRKLLVDQHASNRSYHRTLANTWMNLGWVASELNELETAQNNYSIAQDIREILLQSDPRDLQVLRDIGRGCNNQAELARRGGDFDSARQQLNKAIEIFQRILLRSPDNIQDRYRLAVCYRGHADMTLQLEKELPAARTSYQKSVELMTLLVRENPRVGRYQFELAQLYRNMGYLETRQARWDAALAVLHIAQAKLATLISNFPEQATFQHELAFVRMDSAEVHFENGDPEEGRRQLRQAIDLLETLSRQFPENADRYQQDLEEARGFLEAQTNATST